MPPTDWEQGIGLGCFGFSYAIALALGVAARLPAAAHPPLAEPRLRRRRATRPHPFHLLETPRLASPFGSLVLLAWVMAVFYFYGSIHYRRIAWGLFVLPLCSA